MKKFFGFLALCAVLIYWRELFAEGKALDPAQDANKAKFTEPVILIYQECSEVPPDVEKLIESLGGERCETKSKYIWAPSFAGGKAVACLRARNQRLAQCFYRNDEGVTLVIPILPRGENI